MHPVVFGRSQSLIMREGGQTVGAPPSAWQQQMEPTFESYCDRGARVFDLEEALCERKSQGLYGSHYHSQRK